MPLKVSMKKLKKFITYLRFKKDSRKTCRADKVTFFLPANKQINSGKK